MHTPQAAIRWSALALAILAVPSGAQEGGAAAPRPNVVLILADDMGYGDVRALNPTSKIPTPNLDRLAAEGLTLTDAHSPAAVCTPTRYALLTGRYCWRSRLKSGVLGGYSPPLIEPGRTTFAALLSEHGYRTGAVGKWHLGMALPLTGDDVDTSPWKGDPGIDFSGRITDGPTTRGFDSYFGVSASLDMAPYVWIRDDRFTMEPTHQQPHVGFPHFVRQGPRAEDFVIDEVLDRLSEEACSFIASAAEEEAPSLLYMPLTAPHKPTQPHERFRGKSGLGEYGDFVVQVDWTVGAVLAALDEAGCADDTLVVYSSDNGSYMYRFADDAEKDHVDDPKEHGFRPDRHRANGELRGTKADVWEAGHRVPFFARWPGTIEPGSRSDATVCLTDLYATFAELAGATLPADAAEDSASLVALLSGEEFVRGAPVIHHSGGGMFAIREGRWKLVAGTGSGGRQAPKGKPFEQPFQLYDLEADLGETTDLAPEHADVVEHLTAELDRVRSSGRSVPR